MSQPRSISIEFDTENAAFEDAGHELEAERIIKAAAVRISNGEKQGTLKDLNGNTVGEFKWTF